MKHVFQNDFQEPDVEIRAISRPPAVLERVGRLYYTWGKRVVDIVLSLLALPIAVPVIAFVALGMVVTGDRGPIFFGHKRVGQNRKVFRCWKIRTMVVDAEERLRHHLAANPHAAAEWNRDHKLSDDPRVTRLGRFLRRTSLDELPQLWNVLRGEMSLVGPRPIVRMEMHKYGLHRGTYASVRPGVTGLWQVSGRNDISYAERVNLDVDYVSNISLGRDFRVLAGTVGSVLNLTGK